MLHVYLCGGNELKLVWCNFNEIFQARVYNGRAHQTTMTHNTNVLYCRLNDFGNVIANLLRIKQNDHERMLWSRYFIE